MATGLQVFTNHEFGTIRTITSSGQILFCGKDVATALGYANTKDALARHCKGVVNHYPLETAGGVQQVRFISEGDLYRLIVTSKLPAAQKFETWVFDEVLPTIRRHGIYAIDELLADDEFLERAITTLRLNVPSGSPPSKLCWSGTEGVVLRHRAGIALTDHRHRDRQGLRLSAKKLNQILREEQVQFHQSGRWFLYAKFAEQGYTQSKTHEYDEARPAPTCTGRRRVACSSTTC
ncbi:phage antirepressor protein [Cutibacterium acnes JCM 18918]|nr:phage antirepressor protein [Cutibacterium acnes JCM 18918]